MSLWNHILYYILYKKYRILVSNVWVWKGVEHPLVLDRTIFESLDGNFYFGFYKNLNYITIYNSPTMNDDSLLKFRIDDGINGHVSAFFIANHKDKLILSTEDKIAYQRDSKLKNLGI